MTAMVDMTGRRFGRLTVIERDHSASGGPAWCCLCDCGNAASVRGKDLRRGMTESCGCLQRERSASAHRTHGEGRNGHRSAEYQIWAGMLSRCLYAGDTNFAKYGARGITVCDRWRYACFLADMGRRPTPKHSIDRIENNGNYEPGNCRWATASEQMRNTRRQRPAEAA